MGEIEILNRFLYESLQSLPLATITGHYKSKVDRLIFPLGPFSVRPLLPRRRIVAVPDVTSNLPEAIRLLSQDQNPLAIVLNRFATALWS